ncbi:MAG TPA: M23 family metallopeptidase [Thermomicrobiales bacterium]|nr:M23 family metallopeptidase [Thermomicrobiales bacterium]
MNRRRLLQTAPAALGAVWLGEAAAQGTPVASPLATPLVLPTSYADVAGSYDRLAAVVLEHGRAAVELAVNGDYAALFDRFSPEMQAAIGIETLGTLLPAYTTGRAHFEVAEYQLVFDAQVTGETMTGTVQSAALYSFSLQRQAGTPDASPVAGTPAPAAALAGQWSGTTQLSDGSVITLQLAFSAGGQRGTLSIPEQKVIDAPVGNIAFHAEQPIGERLDERALPKAPNAQIYWARYDWGGRGLTFDVSMDASGTIVGLQVLPEWQLPPDPAAELTPLPSLQLPFAGLWWVLWGGETVTENYHAAYPQQRHASDIMIWNDGATWHDDPSQNENYWVWGQPVLAPADGTIVAVVDGIAANAPGALPTDPADVAGNHVVLQIGEAAYCYLAHMQAGTIAVSEGDAITTGTHIGLAGNSGNSSEPHLHIHVQNEVDISSPTAFSLPMTFANVLVSGEPTADATLEQGTFVAPE